MSFKQYTSIIFRKRGNIIFLLDQEGTFFEHWSYDYGDLEMEII